MQELVRKLKSHGYCVYYLSNIPEDVLDFLTERDLKGLFDGGVAHDGDFIVFRQVFLGLFPGFFQGSCRDEAAAVKNVIPARGNRQVSPPARMPAMQAAHQRGQPCQRRAAAARALKITASSSFQLYAANARRQPMMVNAVTVARQSAIPAIQVHITTAVAPNSRAEVIRRYTRIPASTRQMPSSASMAATVCASRNSLPAIPVFSAKRDSHISNSWINRLSPLSA